MRVAVLRRAALVRVRAAAFFAGRLRAVDFLAAGFLVVFLVVVDLLFAFTVFLEVVLLVALRAAGFFLAVERFAFAFVGI